MKVAHLVDRLDSGGAAQVAITLNHAMRRAGADSTILTLEGAENMRPGEASTPLGAAGRLAARVWRRLDRARTRAEGVPAGTQFNRLFGVISPLVLTRGRAYDVIHFHNFFPGLFRFKRFGNATYIWTVHDYWIATGGCRVPPQCSGFEETCSECPLVPSLQGKINTRAEKQWKRTQVWRAIDGFISPSKFVAGRLARVAGFPKERVCTIPNPVDCDEFFPEDQARARHRLGLGYQERVILFGANFIDLPNKGAQYLPELMTRLGGGAPWRICVFGRSSAPITDVLPAGAWYLGASNQRDTLKTWYSAADVFISLSKLETFGMMVAESLACGTPVVAWDAGGTADILSPDCGCITKYGDVAETARLISHVYGQRTMRENARHRALAFLAANRVASLHFDKYEQFRR